MLQVAPGFMLCAFYDAFILTTVVKLLFELTSDPLKSLYGTTMIYN